MRTLIFLALLIAISWIATSYLKMRREHRLRHAPRAPRAIVEVMLPRDVKNANECMGRFFKMAASLTISDGPERKEGKGQIDIIFLANRAPGRNSPTLKYLIECDEAILDRVKRGINTCFDGDAAIIEVAHSPLAPIEALLLAEAAKHGHGSHQQEDIQR